MKFAVTGGSGFIGSNFTKKLIDKHEVTVLSEKPKTQAFRLKKIFDSIEYKKVNLQNLKEVKRNLRDFDVVAHFAARANTAPVTNRTDLDPKIGIISTYNILEAMRVNRIKKIIFASGPAVYGQTTKFNLLSACIAALKNLVEMKIKPQDIENLGIITGKIEEVKNE